METVEQPWERRVVLVSRQTFCALQRAGDRWTNVLTVQTMAQSSRLMKFELEYVRQDRLVKVESATGREPLCHLAPTSGLLQTLFAGAHMLRQLRLTRRSVRKLLRL